MVDAAYYDIGWMLLTVLQACVEVLQIGCMVFLHGMGISHAHDLSDMVMHLPHSAVDVPLPSQAST
jgi:hypothetical protein